MKHTYSRAVVPAIVAAAVMLPRSAHADPVEDLAIFSAGTTARADEVNGNFSEVADSVNDNDARVVALEEDIAELRATQESLQGCATLDPSDEMVKVGGVCIDKYEASIWDAPVGGNQIIGDAAEDYCNPNGQDCADIYARSVAGVEPARWITWFQAQQALANSGKRLPTNAEWQQAVAGTPDPAFLSGGPDDCNTNSGGVDVTGARENCLSRWGTADMIGNLWEWVADWVPRQTCSGTWPAGYGGDLQRLCGAAESGAPGVLVRGGDWNDGSISAIAGAFAVDISTPPSFDSQVGFRGAR